MFPPGRPRGSRTVTETPGASCFRRKATVSPRTSLFGAPGSSAGLLTVLAYAALFFATRVLVRTDDQARRLLLAPAVAAALASGYACVQALGADPLVWEQVANVGSWRRPFATLGHATFLYDDLTVADNLTFSARAAGADASSAAAAMTRLGLDGRLRDVPAGRLSAGQRRRVAAHRSRLRRRPSPCAPPRPYRRPVG